MSVSCMVLGVRNEPMHFGELFHRERLVQNGVHSGSAPGLRPGAGDVRESAI